MTIVETANPSDIALLRRVEALARANASTLGFLPSVVFQDRAQRGHLLVAIDGRRELQGYLLYATNSTEMIAYIVHLCVDSNLRNRGIARSLFTAMVAATSAAFYGIRVRCRRDYAEHTLWPKLGFRAVGEMPGRSKHGSTLTIFWYDFGHPTLFTAPTMPGDSDPMPIPIDANIFFDLEGPKQEDSSMESLSLQADWLHPHVQINVTGELYNEINRGTDSGIRERNRLAAKRYPTLQAEPLQVKKALTRLAPLFPKPRSQQDESDMRQVAQVAAAQGEIFLTRDNRLLQKASDLYAVSGVKVMRPTAFVLDQDQALRERAYRPERFGGTPLTRRRVTSDDLPTLVSVFNTAHGESQGRFRDLLLAHLSSLADTDCYVVEHSGVFLALLSEKRVDSGYEIGCFRTEGGTLGRTVARQLATDLVLRAARRGLDYIAVADPTPSPQAVLALRDSGFWNSGASLARPVISGIFSREELLTLLASRANSAAPSIASHYRSLSREASALTPAQFIDAAPRTERHLWPAKIAGSPLTNYLIPIRPRWAMELFDAKLASSTLFGSHSNLILSAENAYYSARARHLSLPARILWYVSGAQGFTGVKAVRAASLLDESAIGTAKELYSRFRRLGVYTWSQVRNLGSDKLLALQFSHTEPLNQPVSRDRLQSLWQQHRLKNFSVMSITEIEEELFFDIYRENPKS